MGAIVETATGRRRSLEGEHFVGRAGPPKCSLTLDEQRISSVHAVLRWTEHGWELKDLGSRNGTFVDGHRMGAGEVRPIRKGSKVGFGTVEQEWELVDESSPPIMVVPLDGGEPVLFESEIVSLPSEDDPKCTIYRQIDGAWTLERADRPAATLVNADTFEALDRVWRFCCPTTLAATAASGSARPVLQVATLHLTLSVSQNEEYVHARASCDGTEFDLGASVYNYLLLTLARRRIADAAQGHPEASCGWVAHEDLSNDPLMSPAERLNLAVFRARQQFAKLGIADAAMIIERRASSRELRIGTSRLSVVRV